MIIVWKQSPKTAVLNKIDKRRPLGYGFVLPYPYGFVLMSVIQTVEQINKIDMNGIIEFAVMRLQEFKCVMYIFRRTFLQFSRIPYNIFLRHFVALIFTLNERNTNTQKN